MMKCTPVLHGGVCHRTSTPHKSGNKIKEKKKNPFILRYSASFHVVTHSNANSTYLRTTGSESGLYSL